MELQDLLSLAALVVAIAWLPIVRRFLSAWRARHNPVTLAICGTIVLLVYMNFLLVMVFTFHADAHWALAGGVLFNAIACANYYGSFHWAAKRFKEQRNTPSSVEPPIL